MQGIRMRVRLEQAIAIATGVLGLLTVFWHDWIEGLTGWDPDHHNGVFEWILVGILLVVSASMFVLARRDARRIESAPSPAVR